MSKISHRRKRNNRNVRRRSAGRQKKRNDLFKFFAQKKIGQCATCKALNQNAPNSFLKCEHKSHGTIFVTEITHRPSYKKWKNEILTRFLMPKKKILKPETEQEKIVIENSRETEKLSPRMQLVRSWLMKHVLPRMLIKDDSRSTEKKMENMAVAEKEEDVKEVEQIFQNLGVDENTTENATEN